MVSPRPSIPAARAQRARRAHRSERGAAVFVVVLVLAMLTGIGLFAARASSQAVAASGFERQMSQTHHVTEFAMLSTAAELTTQRREAYVKRMATNPVDGCAEKGKVGLYTCYRFGYEELSSALAPSNGGEGLVRAADKEKGLPGSLGHGDLEADFVVAMTDLAPATPPVAGMDLTSAGAVNVQYVNVTLTAIGQVRPRVADRTKMSETSAGSASTESLRARLMVGPVPKF